MVTSRPTHYRKADLTPRQREVLGLLAKGLTNAEIADRLDVSLAGAKYHVSEVITRLNVDSRDEAADWWREQNSLKARVGGFFAIVLRPAVALRAIAAVGAVVVVAAALLFVSLRMEDDDQSATNLSSPAEEPDAAAPTPLLAPAPGTVRWATQTGPVGGPHRLIVGGTDGQTIELEIEGDSWGQMMWSPDGLSLAVVTDIWHKSDLYRDGSPEVITSIEPFLRIVDVATGQVTSVPVQGSLFAWSPDSTVLAVLESASMVLLDRSGLVLHTVAITPAPNWDGLIWSSNSLSVAVVDIDHLTLVSLDGTALDKPLPVRSSVSVSHPDAAGPFHAIGFEEDTITVVQWDVHPPRPVWSWDTSQPSAEWQVMPPQVRANITEPSVESMDLAQQTAGLSAPGPANWSGNGWYILPYHVQQSGAIVFAFGTQDAYDKVVVLDEGRYEVVPLPVPIEAGQQSSFVLVP